MKENRIKSSYYLNDKHQYVTSLSYVLETYIYLFINRQQSLKHEIILDRSFNKYVNINYLRKFQRYIQ